MKNQELFDRTIAILVKAYQKETIKHSDCTACAVGNLICANMYGGNMHKWEMDYMENSYSEKNNWSIVFMTVSGEYQNIHDKEYKGIPKQQIDSTGYSLNDLAKIEFAFEFGFENESNDDEGMFNGLMSIVDTLMEIHEANETEIKQVKNLFTKELAV